MAAVDPIRLVREHLSEQPLPPGAVIVIGAGKAAARMAAGAEQVVPLARLTGAVVTAAGCEVPLVKIGSVVGSHPLPDERSVSASGALCDSLDRGDPDAAVLALISGGASSLLVRPRPPVSLADTMAVNRLLLACGADIVALNTVRKHLSEVKGGGLLRWARGRSVRTLILSDVAGDDPHVIGSGPTVADPTTFDDALEVLRHHRLMTRVPSAVLALLEAGARGEIAETVKPTDRLAAAATAEVIGNNMTACRAAAACATGLGYQPIVDDTLLTGDTTEAARRWAGRVASLPRGGRWCAIAGGETTVVVRGSGRGGRNQEFALVAALAIGDAPIAVLSAGTDGIDGPTDAAGAYADGHTLRRAHGLGLDPEQSLAENDAYPFFDRLGDLLRTGPTGTNVMDLKLAVGVGSAC